MMNPIFVEKEKELARVFGTKARITSRKGRHAIILEFFSDEEFHAALERILNA